MINTPDQSPPGLFHLLRRLLRTGTGALHNRAELLSIEWQQEKARLAALLVLAGGLLFFAVIGTILLLGAIVMLFPAAARVYALAGLAFLHLGAAIGLWFALKKTLRLEPFPDTRDQLRKDGLWLDSSKTRN